MFLTNRTERRIGIIIITTTTFGSMTLRASTPTHRARDAAKRTHYFPSSFTFFKVITPRRVASQSRGSSHFRIRLGLVRLGTRTVGTVTRTRIHASRRHPRAARVVSTRWNNFHSFNFRLDAVCTRSRDA
jgi:hypothetical protein